MNKNEARQKALVTALDYHSRTYGPVNYQLGHGGPERRPSPDEVIATAQKFLGFMLVERTTVRPRGRK